MRITTLIALALAAMSTNAQGPMSLSLQQAIELAAKQSYAVQTSELEAEKARRKINEVMAIGLPQVNADAGIQNYIDVPVSVVPNFFGGGSEGPEYLEAQFGVPWTTNARVQLNQLIFDGSYLIGLKATKELRQQSEQELQLSIRDAKAAAAKAYYGALAADEGAVAMAEIVPVLERSLREAEAMQQNGFMEETDADRIRIELVNTQDQLIVFERQRTLAMNFLRFYLGLPASTPLDLTDELATLIDDPAERALAEQPLNLETHVEHRIAASRVRLQGLNVRNEKAAYLPKLGGFFSYQQQAFGVDNVIDTDWYPATLWGLSLEVPIFSSGLRSSKVAQAKLQQQQVDVNMVMTTERLRLEEAQDRSDAEIAYALYETQKERLALARKVFERTTTKFTEGLSSSFELTTEQSNYLQEQQSYIQRVAELVDARTELRKTLDLF
jgi:outer membrane protein TolC